MRGETAMRNPPVVVSRGGVGGVTHARPFVVREWPGGWGGSPPGGRPILDTFNGDFPCFSLLFHAFLCFSVLPTTTIFNDFSIDSSSRKNDTKTTTKFRYI